MFLKVSQISQENTLFNKVAGLKAWWCLSCKTFKSIFFCVTPPMKAFVEPFEAPHRSEKIKFNYSHAWLSRWTHYSAVTPCFSLFFSFSPPVFVVLIFTQTAKNWQAAGLKFFFWIICWIIWFHQTIVHELKLIWYRVTHKLQYFKFPHSQTSGMLKLFNFSYNLQKTRNFNMLRCKNTSKWKYFYLKARSLFYHNLVTVL